ncbi:MAG: hypothetical protein AB9866_18795 [Syntrophobacteraceae bacterium]
MKLKALLKLIVTDWEVHHKKGDGADFANETDPPDQPEQTEAEYVPDSGQMPDWYNQENVSNEMLLGNAKGEDTEIDVVQTMMDEAAEQGEDDGDED